MGQDAGELDAIEDQFHSLLRSLRPERRSVERVPQKRPGSPQPFLNRRFFCRSTVGVKLRRGVTSA